MTEEANNNQGQSLEPKEPNIGEFSLPGVIGFSSIHGNHKINAEDAFINGTQLSGMYDHLVFKLTVRDNETIDFEEMDTTETTSELRKRLLNNLIDSEPILGKLGGMYDPALFTFISTIESKLSNKQIPLVLLTKYKTSIDRLNDIVFDDIPKLVIDEQAKSSINDFLVSLGVDPDISSTPSVEMLNEVDKDDLSEQSLETEDSTNNKLKISKDEMIKANLINRDEMGVATLESNEFILKELNKRIDLRKADLISNDERKVEINDEINDLSKRISAIGKVSEKNGMLFCVSEQIEREKDKSDYIFDKEVIDIISDKVATIPNVNLEAFLNLFKVDKYIITIGNENGEPFNNLATNPILPKNTYLEDGKFIYRGVKKWHDLVDEMFDLGYSQDADFNKKAGSNSYVFIDTKNPHLELTDTDNNLDTNEYIVSSKNGIKRFFQSFSKLIKSLY
jgi:hypothetical protein